MKFDFDLCLQAYFLQLTLKKLRQLKQQIRQTESRRIIILLISSMWNRAA